MMFTLGVILFALGIGASIALHEYGHLAKPLCNMLKEKQCRLVCPVKVFNYHKERLTMCQLP